MALLMYELRTGIIYQNSLVPGGKMMEPRKAAMPVLSGSTLTFTGLKEEME